MALKETDRNIRENLTSCNKSELKQGFGMMINWLQLLDKEYRLSLRKIYNTSCYNHKLWTLFQNPKQCQADTRLTTSCLIQNIT